MEPLVQLNDVWKSYGSAAAVRGLSFTIPPGSLFGFLGPNGAGKSTTIRLMLGLQRPNRGSITVFGRSLELHRTSCLQRIGSLVESPSLYQHLSGREHLEIHRRLLDLPKQAIDRALDAVGLLSVARRVVRTYSSGMKQRLGLAQALLGNPDLLLLDEPTNGLDPNGIHEMRTLIRELPTRSGATVFLSSHLLSEVDQIATHFAIISQGQLKFEGTSDQLHLLSEQVLAIETDLPERAEEVLISAGYRVRVEGRRLLVEMGASSQPARINSLLVHAGLAVSHLSIQHKTLEEVFLDLTRSSQLEMEQVAE